MSEKRWMVVDQPHGKVLVGDITSRAAGEVELEIQQLAGHRQARLVRQREALA